MPQDSRFVFLNGRIVKAANASVSVFDRGLLYGDGLFETIRAYRGVPLALEEHLSRCERSACMLGFRLPDHDWSRVIRRLLQANGLDSSDAALRLTVTRGPGEPNLIPPPSLRPTTIVTAREIDPAVRRHQRRGVSITVLPFTRDGMFAEHKLLAYVPAILGKVLAAARGCDEGIYVAPDGTLREATTASLFIVRSHSLLTVPVEGLLPGITRQLVLDLAARAGIQAKEEALSCMDLRHADEAFLTSSIAEILPVIRFDQKPIGSGRPGNITRRMQTLYRRAVARRCSRPELRQRRRDFLL